MQLQQFLQKVKHLACHLFIYQTRAIIEASFKKPLGIVLR